MRHLLIYFLLILPGFATAQTDTQTPEKRCRYRPSREFLLAQNDSCFDITYREADRALAARCWDEAMLLYRAAKSCADANQKARSEMNKWIQVCRDSAEQELRDSELAARRQFLHAVAANLAYESRQLLINYDRSTSYRLADFAGQYVAPGPNPDCLQALFDAWYYVPPNQTGQQNGHEFQVPFCYQIDYDLGNNVQARFGKNGKSLILYAFSPNNHTLYSWDAESHKPGKPIQIEEGYDRFDISPDGSTLLFFSEASLLFWRSQSDIFRLNVPKIGRYCFSASGDEFLFFDENESKIFALELRNAYAQRKGEQRATPRLLFSNWNDEVLGMAYHEGRIWLGGRDSLTVLQRAGKETQWQVETSLHWGHTASYATDLQLFPTRQAAFLSNAQGAVHMKLAMSDGLPQAIEQGRVFKGITLAIRQDAALIAQSQTDRELLLLLTVDSSFTRHGAFLHPGEEFAFMNGAFSPDGKWFAAATDTGVLKLWALAELQSDAGISLVGPVRSVFSQNDDYFSKYRDGMLQVCSTDQPDKSLFSLKNIPENTQVRAVGKNWLAYSKGDSLLTVENGLSGKKWVFTTNIAEPTAAMDEGGQYVAYSFRADSVVVRSLRNGEAVDGKALTGFINNLYFVPNTGEVVIIQSDSSLYSIENQIIAKIWKPLSRAEKMNTTRLHGYEISWVAISAKGDQVAFSDTKDIRVFRLNNLLDEYTRIRQNGEHYVTNIAFHPDGTALAAGYDDGGVIVWDLTTSEPRFELHTNKFWIEELSFSHDGSRLRMKTLEGDLFVRDIEPAQIRKAAQTENRRLVAFTPEQIRGYGLEKALDYSGKFQLLAESKDLPLIRSFFEYYRLQALSSNNIERVKSYFESASNLFSKLDDPVTQRALRPTMHEIYEDYIWKLLLREKNQEAIKVLNEFNQVFEKPLAALKVGAHTALLRNDLPTAVSQYAEWTMRLYEDPSTQPMMWASLENLKQKFRQLAEYGLLQPKQLDCICGLYSDLLEINSLCPGKYNSAALPFNNETRLHWNIFKRLYTASRIANYSKKARLLQSALADAQTLHRQTPTRWRGQLEKTALALAQAFTAWGSFEQENEYSEMLYREALHTLDTFGVFKNNEQERLKALTDNHLRLGNYLLSTDHIAEAVRQYKLGLEVTDRLLRLAPADSLPVYRNDIQAPLLTQLGTAQLQENNAPAARASFQQAYDALTYGLNSFYFGHAALLEGKEDEALSQYRGIYNEAQLGLVLFEVSRLAVRFPERRARLESFIPRLRDTILHEHPEMSPDATDYWYASNYFVYTKAKKQWKSTLDWSVKIMAAAEKLANQPGASIDWKSRYLDATLSVAFYYLHLSPHDPEAFAKATEVTEQAESYAAKEHPYYTYREWFKMNLAHAYLLRNRAGDREAAIGIYADFLKTPGYDGDNWELLQKDFRDLHRAGLQMPNLKGVIEAIKPANIELSPKEWQEMGILPPGN